jgi:hypothetical protein
MRQGGRGSLAINETFRAVLFGVVPQTEFFVWLKAACKLANLQIEATGAVTIHWIITQHLPKHCGENRLAALESGKQKSRHPG